MNKHIIKREFKFLALQRSGHHGIMSWIFDSFKPVKLWINHCHPQTGQILGSGNPLSIKNNDVVNCVMFNVENPNLDNITDSTMLKRGFLHYVPQFTISRSDIIIVVRDCYNNLASCFKSNYSLSLINYTIIPTYKKLLKQMLKTKNFFPGLNTTIVNFNEWFKNSDYRQSIINDLDLSMSNEPYQVVAKAGKGSSFDKLTMDNNAQSMKVLSRYENYLTDKKFISLFKDNMEIVELSKEIFGLDPLNLL